MASEAYGSKVNLEERRKEGMVGIAWKGWQSHWAPLECAVLKQAAQQGGGVTTPKGVWEKGRCCTERYCLAGTVVMGLE